MLFRDLTGHWLVGIQDGRLKAPKNDFCRSCRGEEEENTVEGNPLIDDLTEISEIYLKNISAFMKSSGWKTC